MAYRYGSPIRHGSPSRWGRERHASPSRWDRENVGHREHNIPLNFATTPGTDLGNYINHVGGHSAEMRGHVIIRVAAFRGSKVCFDYQTKNVLARMTLKELAQETLGADAKHVVRVEGRPSENARECVDLTGAFNEANMRAIQSSFKAYCVKFMLREPDQTPQVVTDKVSELLKSNSGRTDLQVRSILSPVSSLVLWWLTVVFSQFLSKVAQLAVGLAPGSAAEITEQMRELQLAGQQQQPQKKKVESPWKKPATCSAPVAKAPPRCFYPSELACLAASVLNLVWQRVTKRLVGLTTIVAAELVQRTRRRRRHVERRAVQPSDASWRYGLGKGLILLIARILRAVSPYLASQRNYHGWK